MPKTLGQLATEVLQKKYEKPSSGIPETDLANSIEQKFDDLADQVDDVRINGTSVVRDGIAYIPMASSSNMGAVKIHAGNGLYNDPTNGLEVSLASDALIKYGTSVAYLTSVANQHKSTFYGLAKAAGADMASSNNAVGTYTDEAKTAIRTMIGAAATTAIPSVPVRDVQVDSTSILNNGVANVPIASDNVFGVMKIMASNGIALDANKRAYIVNATSAIIKAGTNEIRPITPNRQQESVFYGLAKAAGADMASSSNPVGTYTAEAKQAIQNMLGITDLLSTEETTTATAAHALNSLFLMGGKLYKATAAIAIGDAVEVGTNCEVVKADEVFPHDIQVNGTSVMSDGVANIPIATSNSLGVVKGGGGITVGQTGALSIYKAGPNGIKSGTLDYDAIVPANQHQSVFYGLAKVAGADEKDSELPVGTYSDNAKTAIRTMLGAAAASDVTVSDVQVNGTSVLSNGVANIPIAVMNGDYGLVKIGNSGVNVDANGILRTIPAGDASIKGGTVNYNVIAPLKQHMSTFYGLAKAAGSDEKDSTLPVGTYTEAAKASIRNMLGAASTNIVAVQDEQPTDTDTKVWLPETQAAGVQVPTMEDMNTALAGKVSDVQVNGTSVVTNGVANVPVATASQLGTVFVNPSLGLYVAGTGSLTVNPAGSPYIKAGTNGYFPIVSSKQHEATFYGLAKAAGDTTQSQSDNAVGTYTTTASAAIRNMIGAVGDVQVNETSIVSNGIANIPVASTSTLGVVGVGGSFGIKINENGKLYVDTAGLNAIKSGNVPYSPISAMNQHQSVFYGLAKAAGDVTQSASDNAVGTYTAEAKSAIQSMLGIDLQSIASEVEIPLIETVSGTTPSITGQPNTRYVCGEVSTLSITPPSAGSIDIIFDSGSTPAVITVPNTVRWPAWFDATALEADTTYEILITDGVYGSVMTWEN